MSTRANAATDVLRTDYQRSVAAYWNSERDPVNLRLGDVDGLYHHHYGIGEYDPSVLEGPEATRDKRIIAELHRLETAQADVLLDYLGDISPTDRLLDAGSGRGGTSFMANQRFGCEVDGVSISQQQVDFANGQAAERGVADRVEFHFRNMLDTGFGTGSRRGIWTNETTMYVDLFELYGEFARLLEYGGRYVCITGCYNDVTGGRSKAVSRIDEHYTCNIHSRSEYFKALTANNLVPISVVDLTAQTIPYWELRAKSSVATGIEDPFLTAYREGSFHYLLIAADRF
jgi:geranyl diphosphate 2-C-methyltransferase